MTINFYTPYYCEENIWHLCREPQFAAAEAKVLFISNARRQCYFWEQRASLSTNQPIGWDYHVILLARDQHWQVWDLDTTLRLPTDAKEYLNRTFQHVGKAPAEWDPIFRVIEPKDFIENFASDRSHMLDAAGGWLQPPPPWEPIGIGKESNLHSFINMDDTAFGIVMNLTQLRKLVADDPSP
jgi:hypothetical protein